jgi:DNA-binding NtrC family response regulator
MQKVIIFSEERNLKDTLKQSMDPARYRCDEFWDKSALLDQIGLADYSMIMLDANAVGEDMDLVSMLREGGHYKILWLTPESGIGSAAAAIQRGADFYLTLPLQEELLKQLIAEWERRETAGDYRWWPETEAVDLYSDGVIGRSEEVKRVFLMAARVAPTDSPVLITGETGVGKELVARAIHRLSDRANQTFVAVNCAAIPENLLESELFGVKKGAFTGAVSDRRGLFEQADHGTFFLDEIGELAPGLQAKLLRILEEGKVRPLGSSEETPVNVRILAATNCDLREAVKNGKFREDLFYRIHVINIRVPALRERPEDIPLLIKHFLEKYNRRFKRNVISITREAIYGLMHYDYPGNIRELENIMQHGVLLSEDNVIGKTSLPPQVFQKAQLAIEGPSKEKEVSIQRAEEDLIKQALTHNDGNQTEAAKQLGISRSTLWRKIKTYKLENFK